MQEQCTDSVRQWIQHRHVPAGAAAAAAECPGADFVESATATLLQAWELLPSIKANYPLYVCGLTDAVASLGAALQHVAAAPAGQVAQDLQESCRRACRLLKGVLMPPQST